MLKTIFMLAKASIILLIFIFAGCKSEHLGMLGGGNTLEELGNNEVKNEETALTAEVKLLIESCGNAYQAFYVALSTSDYKTAKELLTKEIIPMDKRMFGESSKLYCHDYGNLFGPPGIDLHSSTLLHLAVKGVKEGEQEGLAFIKMLHELGGKDVINKRDGWGETALDLAIRFDKLSIVKYLIDRGVDIYARASVYHNNPLELALASRRHTIALLLVKHICKDDIKMALTHCAALCDKEFAEILLSEGADITAIDAQGKTAFHFAADGGNMEMLEYLHNSKAIDINAKDKSGNNVLHAAAMSNKTGKIAFIKKLINEVKFDDINGQNNSGNTALHYAISSVSAEELVEFLIMQGADLLIKNNQGDTPLHTMANRGTYNMINKFIAMLEAKATRLVRLSCLATRFNREQYLEFETNMFKQILAYGDPNLAIPNHRGEVFAELCRERGFEDLAVRVEAIVSTYAHQEE